MNYLRNSDTIYRETDFLVSILTRIMIFEDDKCWKFIVWQKGASYAQRSPIKLYLPYHKYSKADLIRICSFAFFSWRAT